MEAFCFHLTTYLAGMPYEYMQVEYAYTLVVKALLRPDQCGVLGRTPQLGRPLGPCGPPS